MPSARRAFLKSLAIAPLLPAALTQVAPNPPQPPSPSPATPASEAPSPMAESLAEAARHRFGAHFGPGDMDEIRKTIHANLQAAGRLRTVKLTNADEPVTTFSAKPPEATPRRQPPARPRRR